MRSCILTTAVLLAFSAGLYAFDGDSWIVAGDQVRVRETASVKAPMVAELKAGTVVRYSRRGGLSRGR